MTEKREVERRFLMVVNMLLLFFQEDAGKPPVISRPEIVPMRFK